MISKTFFISKVTQKLWSMWGNFEKRGANQEMKDCGTVEKKGMNCMWWKRDQSRVKREQERYEEHLLRDLATEEKSIEEESDENVENWEKFFR